ncbi:hypothetical protein [Methylopila sp. Yamaguchi]|uniref:hypothetical protein n=1 Tax=Methylopila sp. Yamaguchi TaxID=1437817 RepID=UPI000CBD4542|nr:hypothetical protein [Methylopila sp. Yamaguchi]GBD50607.1 hypothetical protein METY_3820 [Methylopila sp. Yamaguchi]
MTWERAIAVLSVLVALASAGFAYRGQIRVQELEREARYNQERLSKLVELRSGILKALYEANPCFQAAGFDGETTECNQNSKLTAKQSNEAVGQTIYRMLVNARPYLSHQARNEIFVLGEDGTPTPTTADKIIYDLDDYELLTRVSEIVKSLDSELERWS